MFSYTDYDPQTPIFSQDLLKDPHMVYEAETESLPVDQSQELIALLRKPVHILAKDYSFSLNPSAQKVLDCFIQACADMFYLIEGSSIFSSNAKDHQERVSTVISSLTVRGSTVSSMLKKEQARADLDTIIKIKVLHPVLENQKFFQTFNSMIGIRAIELMKNTYYYETGISFSSEGGLQSSWQSACVINRNFGCFDSFAVVADAQKVFFSFSGIKDIYKKSTGIDLDICLQYPVSLLKIRSLSPKRTSEGEVNYETTDAISFGHDAVEIKLFLSAGKIDMFTKPVFSSLFGKRLADIKKCILHRELVVLDQDMHQGYKRVVYEICKGMLPQMAEDAEMIANIVSSMPQEAFCHDISSRHPFYDFIKKKSRSKQFNMNMYLNTYTIVSFALHNDNLRIERPLEEVRNLQQKLAEQFVHSLWKELFPDDLQYLLNDASSIDLITLQQSIRFHLQSQIDSRIGVLLGKYYILALDRSLDRGYFLTPALSLSELLQDWSKLESSIDQRHFESFKSHLLQDLAYLDYPDQDKIKILYFLSRLSCNTFSIYDVEIILEDMQELLLVLMQHPQMLLKSHVKNLKELFVKFAAVIAPDKLVCVRCLDLLENVNKDNPQLVLYVIYMGFVLSRSIELDDLVQIDLRSNLFPYVCSYLFDKNKKFTTIEQIYWIFPFFKKLDHQQLQLICSLVLRSIKKEALAVKDRKLIKKSILFFLNKEFINSFFDEHLIINEKFSIDILSFIQQDISLFFALDPSKQKTIFIHDTLSVLAILQELFSQKFKGAVDCFSEYLEHRSEISYDKMVSFCEDETVQKELLQDVNWFLILKNKNSRLAFDCFKRLRACRQKELIFSFICKMQEIDLLIALRLFFLTAGPMQSKLLFSNPIFFKQIIRSCKEKFNKENIEGLLALLYKEGERSFSNEGISTTALVILLQYKTFKDYDRRLFLDCSKQLITSLYILKNQMHQEDVKDYVLLLKELSIEPIDNHALEMLVKQELFAFAKDELFIKDYLLIAKQDEFISLDMDYVIRALIKSCADKEIWLFTLDIFRNDPKKLSLFLPHLEHSNLSKDELASYFEPVALWQEDIDSLLELFSFFIKMELDARYIELLIEKMLISNRLSEKQKIALLDCLTLSFSISAESHKRLLDTLIDEKVLQNDVKSYKKLLMFLLQYPQKNTFSSFHLLKIFELIDKKLHLQSLALLTDSLSNHADIFLLESLNDFDVNNEFLKFFQIILARIDRGPSECKKNPFIIHQLKRQISRFCDCLNMVDLPENFSDSIFVCIKKYILIFAENEIRENGDILKIVQKSFDERFCKQLLQIISENCLYVTQAFLEQLIDLIGIRPEFTSTSSKNLSICFHEYFHKSSLDVIKQRLPLFFSLFPDFTKQFQPLLGIVKKAIFEKKYDISLSILQKINPTSFCYISEKERSELRHLFNQLCSFAEPNNAADILFLFEEHKTSLGLKPKASLHKDLFFKHLKLALSPETLQKTIRIINEIFKQKEMNDEDLELFRPVVSQYFRSISKDLYVENLSFFLDGKNASFCRDIFPNLFYRFSTHALLEILQKEQSEETLNILSDLYFFVVEYAPIMIGVIKILQSLLFVKINDYLEMPSLDTLSRETLTLILGIYCYFSSFFEEEDPEILNFVKNVSSFLVDEQSVLSLKPAILECSLRISHVIPSERIFDDILKCLEKNTTMLSLDSHGKKRLSDAVLKLLLPSFIINSNNQMRCFRILCLVRSLSIKNDFDKMTINLLIKLFIDTIKIASTFPEVSIIEVSKIMYMVEHTKNTSFTLKIIAENLKPNDEFQDMSSYLSLIVHIFSSANKIRPEIIPDTIDLCIEILRNFENSKDINEHFSEKFLVFKDQICSYDSNHFDRIIHSIVGVIPSIIFTISSVDRIWDGTYQEKINKLKENCLKVICKLEKLSNRQETASLQNSSAIFRILGVDYIRSTAHLLQDLVTAVAQERKHEKMCVYSRILIGFAFQCLNIKCTIGDIGLSASEIEKNLQYIHEFLFQVKIAVPSAHIFFMNSADVIDRKQLNDIFLLAAALYAIDKNYSISFFSNMAISLISIEQGKTRPNFSAIVEIIEKVIEFFQSMSATQHKEDFFQRVTRGCHPAFWQKIIPLLKYPVV